MESLHDAKYQCALEIARDIFDARYGEIRIVVDAEGYLVCEDKNALENSAVFGRKAGYPMRPADLDRLAKDE